MTFYYARRNFFEDPETKNRTPCGAHLFFATFCVLPHRKNAPRKNFSRKIFGLFYKLLYICSREGQSAGQVATACSPTQRVNTNQKNKL